MKKALFTFAILASVFAFMNFSNASANNAPAGTEIPKNIQQIINKSCISCHNSNSTDKKAKEKLNFSKFKYLKTYQRMAKWDKIAEVAINDEMPPKKFKKKHPEKALTPDDLDILTTWVNNMTDAPAQPKVTLDSQLENLINQIVASLAQNDKSKIAVMDFVNMNGEITKLGRYMSEELTTRLYLTGKFEVIERKLLDKIIEEQKISMSGMIDESSAVELGRVLGVDAIASGTITDLGISVKVNARLISAESGKLFSVASVEIPKNDKVKVLLSQSIATSTVAGTTTSTSGGIATPAAVKNPVVTKDGFRFELLNTSVDGKVIILKIKLSNPGTSDKKFNLFGNIPAHSIAFDDLGAEYYLMGVKYVNKPLDGWFDNTEKRMVAGTSMIMELSFENEGVNPQSATKITLLELMFSEGNTNPKRYKVEFRNIPLIKE
jgi:TolB-like protein